MTSVILATLLGESRVRISVDQRTGLFTLEWATSDGATTSTKLLIAQQARLNSNLALVLECLEELRLHVLLGRLEDVCSPLDPALPRLGSTYSFRATGKRAAPPHQTRSLQIQA
jgi:hypothetical protein